MQRQELIDDLKYLAQQGGLADPGLDKHIEFAVARGLSDFWNAHGWSWRTRPYDLTITTSTGPYEMPKDFAGVRTIKQTTSTYGGEIVFYPKEEFDRDFPKPSAYPSGNSIICTAYYDSKAKKSYMQFLRPPDVGLAIQIDMYVVTGTIESVPEGFEGGLMACVEKYMYKLDSKERLSAQKNALMELDRLKSLNTPFKGAITRILQPPKIVSTDTEGIREWFA